MVRLLQFILMISDEELQSLGIQDMALCDLWYSERRSDEPRIENEEMIPDRIKRWLETADTKVIQSEGRRHQTLLRELLDVVHAGQTDTLSRDELALLIKVYTLACQAENREAFERVRRGLEPHMEKITQRFEALPRQQGLPKLTERFRVINTEDILSARAQDVRMVAGVELPSRGPVLTQRGHLRVLGDVPENATLVVEDGDCVIDGFVMGRVAVSGACEVRENLCGVVIARNGDIRARNIVDGAFVVSKRGWVHCRRAQRAKLIFGGECIKIRENSVGGRILSKKIHIEGEAEGGELHVGTELKVKRYKQSVDRPVNVVFRKRLSCKDYGENPGRQMSSDVSRGMRLGSKLLYANRQMILALTEAEQSAANAITYLLIGEDIRVLVDRMVTAQARLNVVDRIMMSLSALHSDAACNLEAAEADDRAETQAQTSADTGRRLDELSSDIDRLHDDADLDGEVKKERNAIAEARKNLLTRSTSPLALNNTLAELGEKLERWRKEAAELEETIKECEARIRAVLQAKNLSIEDSKKKTKLVTLKEIIAKIQAGPKGSAAARRVSAPFTSLMLRTIHTRIEYSKKFRKEIESLRSEFDEVKAKVWELYQLDLDNENDEQIVIRASGIFDPGVRLHADPIFLNDETPSSAGTTITTGANDGKPSLFVCRSGLISEVPIEESALVEVGLS